MRLVCDPAIHLYTLKAPASLCRVAHDATQTGLPFVDACMRELSATGFMSNRGRQNVASLLSKVGAGCWLQGVAKRAGGMWAGGPLAVARHGVQEQVPSTPPAPCQR